MILLTKQLEVLCPVSLIPPTSLRHVGVVPEHLSDSLPQTHLPLAQELALESMQSASVAHYIEYIEIRN